MRADPEFGLRMRGRAGFAGEFGDRRSGSPGVWPDPVVHQLHEPDSFSLQADRPPGDGRCCAARPGRPSPSGRSIGGRALVSNPRYTEAKSIRLIIATVQANASRPTGSAAPGGSSRSAVPVLGSSSGPMLMALGSAASSAAASGERGCGIGPDPNGAIDSGGANPDPASGPAAVWADGPTTRTLLICC